MKRLLSAVSTILDQKEKQKMFKLIALDLIIGVLDIAFLSLLLLIVSLYTQNNTVKNSFVSSYLSNRGDTSLWIIVLFFFLFTLKNLAGYRVSAIQKNFFFGVASRLSKRNILQYIRSNYIAFISIDSSVQIRKISQQPIEFSTYILLNIQQLIAQIILIFFTIIALLFYHADLFFLMVVLLMPPIILLSLAIKKKSKEIRIALKATSEKTIQYLQESITGFTEINIYNKADFFVTRYHTQQQQLNQNIATQQALQSLSPRMIEVFAILGFLMLLLINRLSIHSLQIKLLDIGIFLAASYKIIPGIVKILNSSAQIKAYEFTVNDLQAAHNKEITAKPQPQQSIPISWIKFEKVEFRYKSQQSLKPKNFELSEGDFVGLTGRSGIGKTTIVNLLLGFLNQDNGIISINGKPKNADERQQFWSRISYVKQQTFLFNDSILKNICMDDYLFNEAKLREIIAFCELDQMLDLYHEGVNKMITENGKNISGGQRQRIILARALYHDFDLLILDEAFSEMDEIAEMKMLGKIKQLAVDGKIILMITHNKKAISYCNKIISLDEN